MQMIHLILDMSEILGNIYILVLVSNASFPQLDIPYRHCTLE